MKLIGVDLNVDVIEFMVCMMILGRSGAHVLVCLFLHMMENITMKRPYFLIWGICESSCILQLDF